MINYKVKKIVVDKLDQYHVINTATNVTQSIWYSWETAMTAMRDLNRMQRVICRRSA
jgi:hypothetical protein